MCTLTFTLPIPYRPTGIVVKSMFDKCLTLMFIDENSIYNG